MGRTTHAGPQGETKAPRKRRPMNKYIAAERIDRILADIPPDQRDKVLEFVREGRQVELPLTPGNA